MKITRFEGSDTARLSSSQAVPTPDGSHGGLPYSE
jgi:hypothetical protein